MNFIIPCKLVSITERKIAVGAKKVKNEDGRETTVFEYEPDGWYVTLEFDKTRVSFKLSQDEKPETPLTITLDPNL